MSLSPCCVSGFKWNGTPEGKETKLGKNDTYVTGSNKEVAILVCISSTFLYQACPTKAFLDRTRCLWMDLAQPTSHRRPLCQRSERHGLSTRFVSNCLELPLAKGLSSESYVTTSFAGEVVTPEMMEGDKNFDLMAFIGRNSKEIRYPEIAECAKALKQEHGFKKLGAAGFCYGGWAVFQLGAKGNNLFPVTGFCLLTP